MTPGIQQIITEAEELAEMTGRDVKEELAEAILFWRGLASPAFGRLPPSEVPQFEIDKPAQAITDDWIETGKDT